ncbi:hypothetical protein EPI10_032250 [Gossypium australe]|uniref:Uncharacterized protein n=1 Tax=Gossypium australe TaxID=47621 RepID=A0A5B6X2W5_9ROSI|nr:hypothetical protein EPI10_032250 [Gossypium australe]
MKLYAKIGSYVSRTCGIRKGYPSKSENDIGYPRMETTQKCFRNLKFPWFNWVLPYTRLRVLLDSRTIN